MLIVDRIEGSWVVCDKDGMIVELPSEKVSPGVKSGDVLIGNGDGSFFTVDDIETALRRDRIQQRFRRITDRHK